MKVSGIFAHVELLACWNSGRCPLKGPLSLSLSLSLAHPPICMRALLADIMLVYGLGGRASGVHCSLTV